MLKQGANVFECLMIIMSGADIHKDNKDVLFSTISPSDRVRKDHPLRFFYSRDRKTSQIIRKWFKGCFGSAKTVGGMRKSRSQIYE